MKKHIALFLGLLFQTHYVQAGFCPSWGRLLNKVFDAHPSLDRNAERQFSLALEHLRGQRELSPYSHVAPYSSSIVFQHLNRTLELDPHNVEALRLRGVLSFERGPSFVKDNPQKTIRDLRKVVQLSPADADSRYLLSLSLLRYFRNNPQELGEAISHLSTIIGEQYPNMANAYLARGVTNFFLRDYSLAVEDLDNGLTLLSGKGIASIKGRILFYRGISQGLLNNPEPAIKDLTASFELILSPDESRNIRHTLYARNTHP